jgi:hypothetical protein
MKTIYILLTLLVIGSTAFGQRMTQTAEGESSVLFRGTNITLDIAKTDLSFGLNNLNKTIGETNRYFIGTDIGVKNEEGIGQLFSAGKLVPSAKANFYGGWSWSNGKDLANEKRVNELNEQKERVEKEYLNTFYPAMEKIVLLRIPDPTDGFRMQLLTALAVKEPVLIFKKRLAENEKDSDQIKNAKKEILKTIAELEKTRDERFTEIDKELGTLNETLSKKSYLQIMPFVFGGISASEFKRFRGFDTLNYKNSFTDEYFRGGQFGFGLNAQWRFITFGITYSYFQTNNFDLLTKKEYTFKDVQSNGGSQSLTEEKKITAYAGEYGKVEVNQLKTDLVFNFKLDPKAVNHLLVNPYFQARSYSRNVELLPNTMNVGCGFYFFNNKGKFLGGFYTELPDVKNELEKAKPIADQNLREPLKRITFGIVGKFSFNSLLNLFGQSN